MSFTDLLIHTCTVKRPTTTSTDGYGNPVKTYANHLVDQVCRFSSAKGRNIMRDAKVIVADFMVTFPNIDITEADQIIYSGVTYRILFVDSPSDSTGIHHKTAYVETVR